MFKIQEPRTFLTREEIDKIFYSYELFEKNSFYIIDKTIKEYKLENRAPDFKTHVEILQKASREGHTIIVKNMETYNKEIQEAAEELGSGTDVHLYLVFDKEAGDSFDWHIDDNPVWIRMLYGQKMFGIRTTAGDTMMDHYVKVKEGQAFYLGLQQHRGVPMGPSAMLSFGLPNQADA